MRFANVFTTHTFTQCHLSRLRGDLLCGYVHACKAAVFMVIRTAGKKPRFLEKIVGFRSFFKKDFNVQRQPHINSNPVGIG